MLAGSFPFRLGPILAVLWLLAFAGFACAQNSSPFLAVDPESCAKLEDKNLQVGPPDADIVAACAALSHRAVLGQRFSGGLTSFALLLAGTILVYVVLGVPMRPVFALFNGTRSSSTASLLVETALLCLLRIGVGFAVLAVLSLPFAVAAACLALLAAIILSLRPVPASQVEPETDPRPSAMSTVLADAINDICASSAGILGIAVLARRDPRWLAVGLALAFVASIPAIVLSRRRVRREPTARLATTSILAAIFGIAAFGDPDLSFYSGDAFTPVLAGAVVFALIVFGAGWKARTSLPSQAAS